MHAHTISVSLENEVSFEDYVRGEITGLLNIYYKTNKEASTVFCSIVKHLGSG